MNAKILAAVVGILVLVPAGYASYGWKFGDCFYDDAEGPYELTCDKSKPNASGEPPELVTGHTVYAKFIIDAEKIQQKNQKDTLFLSTDFAAIAGYFVVNKTISAHEDIRVLAQRECVVWFNGQNLDQRPDPDNFDTTNGTNDFPSDEDENAPYDRSQQDYDFDRDVLSCAPEGYESWVWANATYNYTLGAYAVAVEKGDCDPAHGSNFRYRGHLDFVDPNGLYHEVQEYDYNCFLDIPKEHLACIGEDQFPESDRVATPNEKAFTEHGRTTSGLSPKAVNGNASRGPLCGPEAGDSVALFSGIHGDVGVGEHVSGIVEQLFPWTYTDPQNQAGCEAYATPADNTNVAPNATDPVNSSVTPGHFDLGHKCNGSIQDLFKERLWITPVHAPQYDASIQEYYTFALQVDTCAGLNIYEVKGKPYTTPDGTGQNGSQYPNTVPFQSTVMDIYTKTVLQTGYGILDQIGADGVPLEHVDLCTDGSSFSFDDTFRGRTVHSSAPTSAEEIMRGNSFDSDQTSSSFGKHRENCRYDKIEDAPHNYNPTGEPNDPNQVDCYPEDHKTAFVDLYVYLSDPTGGQWALHTKGLGTPTPPTQTTQPAGY